jgi:hypothetical protein
MACGPFLRDHHNRSCPGTVIDRATRRFPNSPLFSTWTPLDVLPAVVVSRVRFGRLAMTIQLAQVLIRQPLRLFPIFVVSVRPAARAPIVH